MDSIYRYTWSLGVYIWHIPLHAPKHLHKAVAKCFILWILFCSSLSISVKEIIYMMGKFFSLTQFKGQAYMCIHNYKHNTDTYFVRVGDIKPSRSFPLLMITVICLGYLDSSLKGIFMDIKAMHPNALSNVCIHSFTCPTGLLNWRRKRMCVCHMFLSQFKKEMGCGVVLLDSGDTS